MEAFRDCGVCRGITYGQRGQLRTAMCVGIKIGGYPTTGASTCHSSRQLQLSSNIPLLASTPAINTSKRLLLLLVSLELALTGSFITRKKDRNQGSTSEPVAAQPEEKTTNKIQSRASDTSQSQSVSQPDTHRSSKHMSGSESAAAALAESGAHLVSCIRSRRKTRTRNPHPAGPTTPPLRTSP